jgi:hypothetical protein
MENYPLPLQRKCPTKRRVQLLRRRGLQLSVLVIGFGPALARMSPARARQQHSCSTQPSEPHDGRDTRAGAAAGRQGAERGGRRVGVPRAARAPGAAAAPGAAPRVHLRRRRGRNRARGAAAPRRRARGHGRHRQGARRAAARVLRGRGCRACCGIGDCYPGALPMPGQMRVCYCCPEAVCRWSDCCAGL